MERNKTSEGAGAASGSRSQAWEASRWGIELVIRYLEYVIASKLDCRIRIKKILLDDPDETLTLPIWVDSARGQHLRSRHGKASDHPPNQVLTSNFKCRQTHFLINKQENVYNFGLKWISCFQLEAPLLFFLVHSTVQHTVQRSIPISRNKVRSLWGANARKPFYLCIVGSIYGSIPFYPRLQNYNSIIFIYYESYNLTVETKSTLRFFLYYRWVKMAVSNHFSFLKHSYFYTVLNLIVELLWTDL